MGHEFESARLEEPALVFAFEKIPPPYVIPQSTDTTTFSRFGKVDRTYETRKNNRFPGFLANPHGYNSVEALVSRDVGKRALSFSVAKSKPLMSRRHILNWTDKIGFVRNAFAPS
jgi:hypothetical protein